MASNQAWIQEPTPFRFYNVIFDVEKKWSKKNEFTKQKLMATFTQAPLKPNVIQQYSVDAEEHKY